MTGRIMVRGKDALSAATPWFPMGAVFSAVYVDFPAARFNFKCLLWIVCSSRAGATAINLNFKK